MDERIIKEINRLKQEIFRQKDKVSDIKELVTEEIDRDFPVDFWELSERELDNEMGSRLSFLNDDIDTRPDAQSITSHRRILGKPIIFIKRLVMKIAGFYTNTVLEKQRSFNEQLVAFHLASFIRFRHNEQKIKEILEKLKALEEEQGLILEQLAHLKNGKQK
ncbi:MAG: hypothetical protein PVH61_07675 [Candidatus Aminicenantes bacterium]|jgi:hypothetical protein